jgi:bla regulator protein blaR1
MNPEYLRPLADHLWQSTLFAGAAGLLTLFLRTNRARVRHWLWLTASCKFLIPLSLLIAMGGHLAPRTTAPSKQSGLSVVVREVGQPFTGPVDSTPFLPPVPAPSLFPAVLLTIWMTGFAGIAVSWWIRWRGIRAKVRHARSVQLAIPIPAKSSPSYLEPGIFGVFRPVLLLPEGIFERLTPKQLKAVIAHELCHFRCRDNLTAGIQMLVETLFWFHPLLWWMILSELRSTILK